MKLTLRQQITQFAHVLQSGLFPVLQEELGELTDVGQTAGGDLGDDPTSALRTQQPRLDRPTVEGPVGDR